MKRKRRTQIINIINERRDITTHITDMQWIIDATMNNYMPSKLDNLEILRNLESLRNLQLNKTESG